MTFSLTQALQFAGIMPSLFVILALLITGKERSRIWVPILYFALLAFSFSLPLQAEAPGFTWHDRLYLVSLFFEACLPVASYLLIMQFVLARPPSLIYWLSLAIPLIGGAPFIYSAAMASDVCIMGNTLCTSTQDLQQFYMLFTTSFLFLLLVVTFSRVEPQIRSEDVNRNHKYWLIIALIIMNLVILISMLAELAERISHSDMQNVHTVVKLSFIYLVITSLFRVFDHVFHIQTPLSHTRETVPNVPSDIDPELVAQLEALLSTEKLYRKMGFTREALAKQLGVGEHVISKTINRYYEMNFNELINSYRIDEAKERLAKEDTTITVIAFEVGFNSIASFNRVFKQKVGKSPTEYRSENTKPIA